VRTDSASRLSANETTGWKPVGQYGRDACFPAKQTLSGIRGTPYKPGDVRFLTITPTSIQAKRSRPLPESIQRAHHAKPIRACRHMQVNLRRRNIIVPKQLLDRQPSKPGQILSPAPACLACRCGIHNYQNIPQYPPCQQQKCSIDHLFLRRFSFCLCPCLKNLKRASMVQLVQVFCLVSGFWFLVSGFWSLVSGLWGLRRILARWVDARRRSHPPGGLRPSISLRSVRRVVQSRQGSHHVQHLGNHPNHTVISPRPCPPQTAHPIPPDIRTRPE